MGLFSFLNSNKPLYSDKVWKTHTACLRGMITDALQLITQNQIPIVFTFFEKTQHELTVFLQSSQVPCYLINDETLANATQQAKVVFLCNAWQLNSAALLTQFLQLLSQQNKVTFFFAGHYPLPDKEKKVVDKLVQLSPTAPIVFCSSLADASFARVGAGSVATLLEQLGLRDEESIEHPLVTKAMQRAREKIQSEVVTEIVTASEEEWYQKNVKRKN